MVHRSLLGLVLLWKRAAFFEDKSRITLPSALQWFIPWPGWILRPLKWQSSARMSERKSRNFQVFEHVVNYSRFIRAVGELLNFTISLGIAANGVGPARGVVEAARARVSHAPLVPTLGIDIARATPNRHFQMISLLHQNWVFDRKENRIPAK